MKNLFKMVAILVIAALSLNAANAKDAKLKAEMMSAWKAQGAAAQKVTKGITDKELIKWMKEDRDFVLVDVREPKEVAAGTILWMDFKAIPRGMVAPAVGKQLALKPSQTIVFYCKFGIRSAYAAQELQKFYGFKNVYYLKGGITNWLKQGHEISNLLGELKLAK
ncbi:rhodanese-like domain-containing protein [Sulfurospirillum sp. 1612]|uniref:rhodanese-like domain-containing protein n=1 Tax=Sulfurospirillum sp. 1612 TaxID=3094835 RepID=UPI002F952AE9